MTINRDLLASLKWAIEVMKVNGIEPTPADDCWDEYEVALARIAEAEKAK